MRKLTVLYGRMEGQTNPHSREASLLKIVLTQVASEDQSKHFVDFLYIQKLPK